MAQQQQQQHINPHEEMRRAFQAARQEDRHWLIANDEEACLYAVGVLTGDLDPTIPLERQTGQVIDLTGHGRKETPVVGMQLRLTGS